MTKVQLRSASGNTFVIGSGGSGAAFEKSCRMPGCMLIYLFRVLRTNIIALKPIVIINQVAGSGTGSPPLPVALRTAHAPSNGVVVLSMII